MTGDSYLTATRGGIFEWQKGDYKNLCVIVSSNDRKEDKIVSIIFITSDRGNYADDIVRFTLNGKTAVVRAGLITYTYRSYLKKRIGMVSKETLNEIDEKMLQQYGLKSSTDESYIDKWLDKCDMLLDELKGEDFK